MTPINEKKKLRERERETSYLENVHCAKYKLHTCETKKASLLLVLIVLSVPTVYIAAVVVVVVVAHTRHDHRKSAAYHWPYVQQEAHLRVLPEYCRSLRV